MAKNLGLIAKIGGGCLATLVSLVGIDAAQALDFNFNWSSTSGTGTSPVFPGTGVGTASGSFTVNKNSGESFAPSDMSNISITLFDGSSNFSRTSTQGFNFNFIEGTISGDGSSIDFTQFALIWSDGSTKSFGCAGPDCDDSGSGQNNAILMEIGTTDYFTGYSSPGDALASISASAIVSTPVPFELNPNSGILILMGLWGTNTLIKRRKNNKSIDD